MAIQAGGGAGSGSAYSPLLGVLSELLGSFYFEDAATDRDEAVINLARLRVIQPSLQDQDRSRIEASLTDDTGAAYNALYGGSATTANQSIAVSGGAFSVPELTTMIESGLRREGWETGVSLPAPGPGDTDPRPAGSEQFSGITLPTPGAGDRDPRPTEINITPASTGGAGGTGGSGGSGGGGWQGQADSSLPAAGTARQIPGGEELWHVDGKVYLAYENPRQRGLWMIWHVESPERLQAIYGGSTPAFDREMSEAQLKRMSPWMGGLSAELQNTSEDPWTQFNSDFNEAAKLRPWLNDPTVQAVMQGAYLEGRAPTQDELSQTDWWQDHTAAERQWLEQSVTMGREELARQRDDAARQVGAALRQAGVSNAPDELVKFIAEQTLTGKWSEAYAQEQVRKLSDPFAPGRLDRGITELLDGVDLDTTRKHEDQVRGLMEEWLGPDLGKFSDRDVARWAGRVRNDPDAAVELEEMLREQRQIILPGYAPNRTYREIITPVENLGTQIWGRPIEDSAFLIDLANTQDYSEMGKRLRSEGRKRGVQKVVNDALAGLGQTALGEQVVRSTV